MNLLPLLDFFRLFVKPNRKPVIEIALENDVKPKKQLLISKTTYPNKNYTYNEVFNISNNQNGAA